MNATEPEHDLTDRADYLARQRWFAGRSARIERIEPLAWSQDPSTGLGVRFELVHTRGADGALRVYNVPASYRSEPFRGLDGALMAREGDLLVYDAMLDAHARSALLGGFRGASTPGVEHRVADTSLDLTVRTATVPLIAEQSNTSIIVGRSLLWKLFRIVEPGPNPDIEIGTALTRTGAPEIAPVRGSIRAGGTDLAMLYDYYPSATDGWDSARASVRDLLAAVGPIDPAAAGADFAAEAERLGATVARVHELMAVLGTEAWGPAELDVLATTLTGRLDQAIATVPALARHRDAAVAAYDDLRQVPDPGTADTPDPGAIGTPDPGAICTPGPGAICTPDSGAICTVQRVHGDLHLGQTLRDVSGWKVFDFEGEPSKPLAERRRLDSPLRDVAGMLRSFDYAPHSVLMQRGGSTADALAAAAAWTERNSEAFLHGYGVDEDPTAYVLLRAHQVDKALYEVVYETHHRPGWVDIPLDALDRLLP